MTRPRVAGLHHQLLTYATATLIASLGSAYADSSTEIASLRPGAALTTTFPSNAERADINDGESNEVHVTAEEPSVPSGEGAAPSPPDRFLQTFPWQIEDCQIITVPVAETHLRTWCAAPAQFTCPAGTTPANPRKYRTRPVDSPTNWSGWQLLNGPCLESTDPGTDDLADAVARELKTLKIPAKRAQIAPITDWFPVQLTMTYYTDAAPETLTTTVLSTDVELELTPTSFTWDPGDGTDAITSTEPGAPYPDDTITHVYKKVGEYRITLTTTWQGRFRVAGTDTWRPITGTGSTTHTTDPFETREIRSVLS